MSRRLRSDIVTPKRTNGVPVPTGQLFYLSSIPGGAYGSPHAAPVVNRRTSERHPLQCACEKCLPGSGCQCYACAWERALSDFAALEYRTTPADVERVKARARQFADTQLDSVRSTP